MFLKQLFLYLSGNSVCECVSLELDVGLIDARAVTNHELGALQKKIINYADTLAFAI